MHVTDAFRRQIYSKFYNFQRHRHVSYIDRVKSWHLDSLRWTPPTETIRNSVHRRSDTVWKID